LGFIGIEIAIGIEIDGFFSISTAIPISISIIPTTAGCAACRYVQVPAGFIPCTNFQSLAALAGAGNAPYGSKVPVSI
jgi:hypothetical protein